MGLTVKCRREGVTARSRIEGARGTEAGFGSILQWWLQGRYAAAAVAAVLTVHLWLCARPRTLADGSSSKSRGGSSSKH